MSHIAFARKYRPRAFNEVVGQEAIAQALRGAVSSDQTAPVYLFSGSHGVGKTSMARIFAKALNCPEAPSNGGEPCLECPTCQSIGTGEALDVIEIDAASNRKIEDARRIRENVLYRPQATRFKIYILDEVHQLTREAFDALLKTFEEAPDHVRFVLATTELHKVPTTIRSRAQVFHFRRATREDVERRLGQIAEAEGVTVEPEALTLLTRRARGSMRDAQKMLDQVVTLGARAEGDAVGSADVARLLGAFDGERVDRLLGGIARGDAAALLSEVAEHLACGGQVATFLDELMDALRATLYVQTCAPDSPALDDLAYARPPLEALAKAISPEGLLLGLSLLAEAEQKLRLAREPRVLLEVCLVRLARAHELRPMGEVLARLERLEHALSIGLPPVAPLGAGPPSAASASPARGPAASRAPSPASGAASQTQRQSAGPAGPNPAARAGQASSQGPTAVQSAPTTASEPTPAFAKAGAADRAVPSGAPPSSAAPARSTRAPQERVDRSAKRSDARPRSPSPTVRGGRQTYAVPDHMQAGAPTTLSTEERTSSTAVVAAPAAPPRGRDAPAPGPELREERGHSSQGSQEAGPQGHVADHQAPQGPGPQGQRQGSATHQQQEPQGHQQGRHQQQEPQGRQQHGPEGRQHTGPQGHFQQGPQGHSRQGPQGRSPQGPQGHSPQGPQAHSQQGPQAHSQQGPQAHSRQGPQGRSPQGPQGHSQQGPQGRSPQGPQAHSQQRPQGHSQPGAQGHPQQGPQGHPQQGPQGRSQQGPQGRSRQEPARGRASEARVPQRAPQGSPPPQEPARGQPEGAGELPPGTGPLTLEAVQALWTRVIGVLADRIGGMNAETLLSGSPRVAVDEGGVIVQLALNPGFAWRQLSEGTSAKGVAECFSEFAGRAVPLRFERVERDESGQPVERGGASGDSNQRRPAPRRSGNALYQHPIVQLAQRELDARPMG